MSLAERLGMPPDRLGATPYAAAVELGLAAAAIDRQRLLARQQR